MQRAAKQLCADQSGVSVTEFGLIAPVVIMMIMGTYDIGHGIYLKSVLNGALQEVGRDSSLEGATVASEQVAIDNRLKELVKNLAPSANVAVSRRYYKTFSQAASANAEQVIEPVANRNGRCDPGETFMDANHNGTWDEDGGNNGQGGARDVVIIGVTVTYNRIFPAAEFIGYNKQVSLVSDSVIANQPYGKQIVYAAPVVENC